MKDLFAAMLFTFFSFFITDFAIGQGFLGGIKAGITASEVSGDRLGNPNKVGLFAAVFSAIPTGTYSQLQMELMYIQKGSRSIPTENNNFRTYKFFLQYVEVPISYRFDFEVFNLPFARRLSGEAGIAGSVLVGHREESNGAIPPEEEKPFRGAELNLLLGLYYPLSGPLDFSIRFTQGVTPIRPHQGGSSVWYNQGQYNSVWSIGLSYTIF